MPAPTFARLSVDEFGALQQRFDFQRRITSVDVHHTWRPRRVDFRGHDTIVAMWRYHTQTNGWRDIGQHLTVDPEGYIWLGRNWNLPPCSAAGANGNSRQGPMMIEVVGDFDTGQEQLDGEQRKTLARLIARIDAHHGLTPDTMRFHRDLVNNAKTCPGTGVDKRSLVAEVSAELRAMQAAPGAPGTPDAPGGRTFVPDDQLDALLRSMERPVPDRDDPSDAEPNESLEQERGVDDASTLGARAFIGADGGEAGLGFGNSQQLSGSGLGPSEIAAMRPHLINLSGGRQSVGGEISTSNSDLDRIFAEHLPAAAERAAAAGKPLYLMLYAHGGLVNEADGLRIAHKHIGWWQAQDSAPGPGAVIYPLYFIWETGFLEIVRQQLLGSKPRGLDDLTDPVLEWACRSLGPRHVWTAMKTNAQRAIDAPNGGDPGGAALGVARRLVDFHKAQADAGRDFEVHAVGHSAGSIFHSWLLPAAHAAGLAPVRSLQLLAPAVRTDLFKQRLLSGAGLAPCIEQLAIYTMRRENELRDTVGPYGKSLLYLIHKALEDDKSAPILGLEESMRADDVLAAALGLGEPLEKPIVNWSPGPCSRSTTHGGFDDDPTTMESVLRRMLGLPADAAVVPFPEPGGSRSATAADPGAGRTLDDIGGAPAEKMISPSARKPAKATPATTTTPLPPLASGTQGSRRALCMGIDAYSRPEHRLSGCVADARAWSGALQGLGFETTVLLNEQVTRKAMVDQVAALLGNARAGDVIVWQYAGHGTRVPDLNGDEDPDPDGQPGKDGALVPFDYERGEMLIDDDIGHLLLGLPDGVNLTVFMDCCHSHTNTRDFLGGMQSPMPPGAKARYFVADSALTQAYIERRAGEPAAAQVTRGAMRGDAGPPPRYAKFAACQDKEVALELNGHGQFTVGALGILANGTSGLSNIAFKDLVVRTFGPSPRQQPDLDLKALGDLDGLFLQPLMGVAGAAGAGTNGPMTQVSNANGPVAGRSADTDLAWTTLAALARAAEALVARR